LRQDEMVVWNAHLDYARAITDFDDPGHSGISVDPVVTPTLLKPNGYASYTVTVSAAGPPSKDTTYVWEVYLTEYETQVIGTRLIPFTYDINWITGEEMTYEWHTSLFIAKTTHEQRRSLSELVFRGNSIYLTLEDEIAFHFINLMKYARGKFFVVPLYNEIVLPSSALSGSTVTSADDLTYHWNLNNFCDYILIVDHENNLAEAKEVLSVGANSITFTTDINGSFSQVGTVLYPTFLGIVENYKYTNVTDSKIKATVQFKEVIVNAI